MNARSFTLALSLFTAAPLWAATPPEHLAEIPSFEVAEGVRARPARRISWSVPMTAAQALARFEAEAGPGWRAFWDADTHVPGRLYGRGLPAPGAMSSPAEAERFARAVLDRHLGLLAPGAELSDFDLVSNDASGDTRTLGFAQRHRGLPVIDGQLNLQFKKDRLYVLGSEALPHVRVSLARERAADERYVAAALEWVRASLGAEVKLRTLEGERILPVIRADGTLDYFHVREVVVDAKDPIGRFAVYLDERTAKPLARRQLLMFQAGPSARIVYDAPERHPRAARRDWPAQRATLVVDGAPGETDDQGAFSWSTTSSAAVRVGTVGPLVRVVNDAGASFTRQADIGAGSTHRVSAADDELADAQINTFVATRVVKERTRRFAPDLRWLDQQLVATVNIDQACNAFADGQTINFFQASNRCQNTGRIADVVYHEFGHTLHANALIRGVGRFDGALSEGASDILSALVTGDPGMGRGFFYSDQPLRHIDPADGEARWPEDVGESHVTGLIYAGALWDLRKMLVATLGEDAGSERLDRLFYESLRRSADIPTSFVQVLAADDDDGNLENGTPNFCLINEAFARHGLADPKTAGPGVQPPVVVDRSVKIPVNQPADCPGTAIREISLEWRLRADHGVGGRIAMGASAGGYEAAIPAQPVGEVVQYKIGVRLNNGDTLEYPSNEADPYYELFMGETVPLYCTDFESDPALEGWRHELVRGENREGADDWQWGEPHGTSGSGDPDHAFSGTRVIGNDLGGGNYNGSYQPNKTNAMYAPPVATKGHTNVRLHYRRWLNVENSFFDKARITSNGERVWQNLDSGERGRTHHQDGEWRFQDVDLSPTIKDGAVQVSFLLETDQGLEMGGWTIDDFCVVAVPAGPICGNGTVEAGEACDDGNGVEDDGCKSDCSLPAAPTCGNGVLDAGEACDPALDAVGCNADCTAKPAAAGPDTSGIGIAESKGCGCESTGARGSSALGALVLAGLVLRRRRSAR